MTRLMATMKLDVTLQFRNKVYHIALALALFSALLIAQFFGTDKPGMERAIPILFLFAVGGTTFMFTAGMVLFEKSENTLEAITVTPMRMREYLLSKIITLTLLTLVESALILGLAYLLPYGLDTLNPMPLILGVLLTGVFHALAGFVLVVRYTTITDFLMPAMVCVLIFQLAFLPFVGMWENPVLYLLPTMPQTLIMTGGFRELSAWEWVYSIGYSFVVTLITYAWAVRAYRKHIIMRNHE